MAPISAKDIRALLAQQNGAAEKAPTLRHKYRAKACEADGIKFPSLRERGRYFTLSQLKREGEVLFFLRQVPFHLPGGKKYVLDFLVFWSDGRVTAEDVKGVRTPRYQLAKSLVEAVYRPLVIEEI